MSNLNVDLMRLGQLALDEMSDLIGDGLADAFLDDSDVGARAVVEVSYLDELLNLPPRDPMRESENAIRRIEEFLHNHQDAQSVLDFILLLHHKNLYTRLAELAGDTDINYKRKSIEYINLCQKNPRLPPNERQLELILMGQLQSEIYALEVIHDQ
jgi:hypothetical protein